MITFMFIFWFISGIFIGIFNAINVLIDNDGNYNRLNIILAIYSFHISILVLIGWSIHKICTTDKSQSFFSKRMGRLQ